MPIEYCISLSDNEDNDISDGFVAINPEGESGYGVSNLGAGYSVGRSLDTARYSNRRRLGPSAPRPTYSSREELTAVANVEPSNDTTFQLRESWKKEIRYALVSAYQNFHFKKVNLACQTETVEAGPKAYIGGLKIIPWTSIISYSSKTLRSII
ncbi:uncharacterized protein J8A68_000257 [[Candida] subhashii]|uniref:Uncharacterized protein n=1 Tax=[Candida] subhashii TaxID=561895 RepID=A0A8J5UUZ4_9ASCO|nr:uncharacterized protein J8A68_000257 [[Candida] subhashii]KAG7666197.1 hypothetical protein J8A68_000257 [[Candida] subhashii]